MESEKIEVLVAAVKSFMEKCKEAVFVEKEEDRMPGEDQSFSEEDDSENEWDRQLYENTPQKKWQYG